MFQKYVYKLYIILFSSFVLLSCTEEYSSHYNGNFSVISWEWYSTLSKSGGIIVFPSKEEKQKLIEKIHSAKKRIWIEVYIWTDTSILDAIVTAKNRSVDVRVILEWNVFWTPRINAPIFDKLLKAWIPVRYSSNQLYVFTHAKFFLIDDTYFISTGNITRSFFEKNRELIFYDTSPTTLLALEKVFLADFEHHTPFFPEWIPNWLTLSPVNARYIIEEMLKSSKNIHMYVQTITDKGILDIVSELHADKYRSIVICTADNKDNKKQKVTYWLEWKFAKKPYLHAKVIIFDDRYVLITSNNLTRNSLDNNREVWILFLPTQDVIQDFKELFKKDCIF